MVEQLLSNPVLALVVVATALLLAKVLKFSGKVIKAIILVGIAYVIVTGLM